MLSINVKAFQITTRFIIHIAIFMSDWIIEILFERDKFTHEDTLKVSLIQKIIFLSSTKMGNMS